jgi:hypothetical protein
LAHAVADGAPDVGGGLFLGRGVSGLFWGEVI